MQFPGNQDTQEKSSGIFSLPAIILKKFSNYTNKQISNYNALSQSDDASKTSYIDTQPIRDLVAIAKEAIGDGESFQNIDNLIDQVTDPSELNHVILAFTDLLNDKSDIYILEKKEKVFQLPISILNYFNFGENYFEESEKLKKHFEKIQNLQGLKGAIQSALELIKRVYADSKSQQKELEIFIYNVGVQINQIGGDMHTTLEKQVSDLQQQTKLNMQMQSAVGDINKNIFEENNIETLKDTIKIQLDSLQKLVEEEQQVIKLQEKHVKKSVQSLAIKVDKLKSETQILRERVKKEKENALRDSLTGLYNREAYQNKLSDLLSNDNGKYEALSLMVWDIDNFKQFNDKYGHVVGDKVLKTVSNKLKLSLKGGYFLARYGGEEFVMLLPDVAATKAEEYANSIREEIENVTFLLKGKQIKITISCGIACITDKDDAISLFKRADNALYNAKTKGRNCVVADKSLS